MSESGGLVHHVQRSLSKIGPSPSLTAAAMASSPWIDNTSYYASSASGTATCCTGPARAKPAARARSARCGGGSVWWLAHVMVTRRGCGRIEFPPLHSITPFRTPTIPSTPGYLQLERLPRAICRSFISFRPPLPFLLSTSSLACARPFPIR